MEPSRERRSARMAVELPIRVYGFDYRGVDFVEDSRTSIVNMHGAKIGLTRNLIPDQEIRILCPQTKKEAVFRVICRAASKGAGCLFWGVESLAPELNIWGIDFPVPEAKDQRWIRVMMQCPECHSRELFYFDEPFVGAVEQTGGLLRGCAACGISSRWKLVPYSQS